MLDFKPHISARESAPSLKQVCAKVCAKVCASAGNRTRAARVAGEHSTTEPPMLTQLPAMTL